VIMENPLTIDNLLTRNDLLHVISK
jgi:hypothetical protein